jgi:molybdenum cofactor synthesis domain-containing protein
MRPLADAQREVLGAMRPLPAEPVDLAAAGGLALAEAVVAPHDVPPFANSGMDGFAVVAADTVNAPVVLEVLEDVPAGSVPTREVAPGASIRIMTGAPLPGGADAVVMVEETEEAGDGKIRIMSAVRPGTAVRPAGGDLTAGREVFGPGTRLTAHHLGVLASIGVSAPVVRRRPVVAVLSTGDEVMPADTATLLPGRIRDANRPMLVGMLGDLGATVLDLGIVSDDARLLRATLEEAAGVADAVVSSGGVSMGDYDLVKQVLGDLGRIDFWQVAMQPAKPFAFGFLGDTPLFGLPGNPVSVTVAFEQFVRPALLTRMGALRVFRPRVRAVLGDPVDTNPDKTVFVRVALTRDGERLVASSTGGQASNVLSALAAADGFAVVPVGTAHLDAGDAVEVELFRAAESRTASEVLS